MQKKILKKICGRVVNRPARPLGGIPPLPLWPILRPFKALFAAQSKNLPRQRRQRLKCQAKRA